ncbi:hypothetical protein [Rufibacter tibetensis]|uniref:hypothetical protein n=1 Tax=Rufibacter tibetensis TaxID=512763 RepID=UPI00146FE908|nr:hypothetical protein [Rufibacter tibetensis]
MIRLLPILSAPMLTCCNWEKGWEERNWGNTSFEIVDASYGALVSTQGKPYHPDTIQVFNQAGKAQPLLRVPVEEQGGRRSWAFDLGYLEGTSAADTDFDKLDKTFYLYLNHRDVDTLRIVGRPDRVYVNGRELGGAPLGSVSQYAQYFYIKD